MRLFFGYFCCRSLYGFVDWNIRVLEDVFPRTVEAYTASWIEITVAVPRQISLPVEAYTASWIEIAIQLLPIVSRVVEAYTASWIEIGLSVSEINSSEVEAYTASWIEILWIHDWGYLGWSKPIRLRGLKSPNSRIFVLTGSVEAYTASWIEIP